MSDPNDPNQPDDAGEMSHMEFLRAQFFVASNESSAARKPVPERRGKTIYRNKTSGEMQALQRFVRALDAMPPEAQRAAICWLADKYLGVRLLERP